NQASPAEAAVLATNSQSLVLSNANAALLRPLLDDMVNQEWFLEIRGGTNRPGELGLAIAFDDARAQLWATNLAAAMESLTGAKATRSADGKPGFDLQAPGAAGSSAAQHFRFQRAGRWSILGIGGEAQAVVTGLAARVQAS